MFQAFWVGVPSYVSRRAARALPHWQKLVQPYSGEDPPQDEVAHLEHPRADAVTVVPPQRLLVSCRPQCNFAAPCLPHHEVHPPCGVLLRLIKRQDPCGAMHDLVGENRFCSVDEEERGLACWPGGGGADGP